VPLALLLYWQLCLRLQSFCWAARRCWPAAVLQLLLLLLALWPQAWLPAVSCCCCDWLQVLQELRQWLPNLLQT
jgi:hypothetical protein